MVVNSGDGKPMYVKVDKYNEYDTTTYYASEAATYPILAAAKAAVKTLQESGKYAYAGILEKNGDKYTEVESFDIDESDPYLSK